MAETTAQAETTEKAEPKTSSRKTTARRAAESTERTTLDSHLDAPSVTVPGDGPADTTDPLERASSATPDKGAAALAGHQTVNAVVALPERDVVPGTPARGEDRVEKYDVVGPDGRTVSVTHNLETGETSTS